jgi:hypothetical protein
MCDETRTACPFLPRPIRHSAASQAEFVGNPAAVINERIFGGRAFRAGDIDRANRIVYALLSNPKFMLWARNYQRSLYREVRRRSAGKTPQEQKKLMFLLLERRQLFRDLAKGLKEFGDPELFRALIGSGILEGEASLEGALAGAASDVPRVVISTAFLLIEMAVSVDQVLAVHQSGDEDVTTVLNQEAEIWCVLDCSPVLLFQADSQLTVVGTESQVAVAADADSQSAAQADAATQAASSSESAAQADSSSAADASSDTTAQADSSSDSSADTSSDSAAQADSGVGTEAGASGFGALFGLSRVELQQFASLLAVQVETFARQVRETGVLMGDLPLDVSLNKLVAERRAALQGAEVGHSE